MFGGRMYLLGFVNVITGASDHRMRMCEHCGIIVEGPNKVFESMGGIDGALMVDGSALGGR